MSETTAERLQIGKVIELTMATVHANFRVLAPLALLFVALPDALLGLLSLNNIGSENSNSSLSTLTQCVLQGAAAYVVSGEISGRRLTFSEALNKAGGVFLPLLGLAILAVLGVLAGMLLLIVPGLILACMWAVAAPVRALEGPGVRRAFGRSRLLTKGYRGHIFLMTLILVVAALVIGLVGGLVGLGGAMITDVVVTPLLTALVSCVANVGAAALYVELRRIKEGGGATMVADVFS